MAWRYSNYDFSNIKSMINNLEQISNEEPNETLKQEMVNEFSQGRGDLYAYFVP